MSIHKIGSDLIRPQGPKGPQGADRNTDSEASSPTGRPARTDQVGFSAEGMALAELTRSAEQGLSVEQIRERVASGYYDDPAVAEQVAARLLDSGDF